MKKYLLFILTVLFLTSSSHASYALSDPRLNANNIFGIHIFDENDLEDAAALVNSADGDWGYVTIVIREDERDKTRWQNAFDKMRKLHLIPIIRLATRQKNGGWAKPKFEDIENWTNFLNSVNWLVENRYIIIGNEPNHAAEWGGEVNPEEYASYLKSISSELKSSSNDFFIIPAGFDSAAPNNKIHMSEFLFIKKMINKEPDIFDFIDGWSSHSYPNPNFSGSVEASGANTIKSYLWELTLLKSLKIKKDLPVFISETGWVNDTIQMEKLQENWIKAYDFWSNDQNIVAVTPFILNYQEVPFNKFSWKGSDGFYPFYQTVQSMPKKTGEPARLDKGKLEATLIPKFIKKDGKMYGVTILENTGQVIWQKGSSYQINLDDRTKIETNGPLFFDIEPGHSGILLTREINPLNSYKIAPNILGSYLFKEDGS